MSLSSAWTYSLDLEDACLRCLPFADVLRIARGAECGTLAAKGAAGDCLELEFNARHAVVWYMAADRILLRPYCMNRPEADQRIEEFFCPSCGVRLGSQDAYLSCGLGREEGFRLFRAVLEGGRLLDAIPEGQPSQRWLPGMIALRECDALGRMLEWRHFRPQGRKHSEKS